MILSRLVCWEEVVDPGQSNWLPGVLVERQSREHRNEELRQKGQQPARTVPRRLGLTQAARQTDSFLAAASFERPIQVLIQAALAGKVDVLRGLKENVLLGRLIPAGTGYPRSGSEQENLEEPAESKVQLPAAPPLTGSSPGYRQALAERESLLDQREQALALRETALAETESQVRRWLGELDRLKGNLTALEHRLNEREQVFNQREIAQQTERQDQPRQRQQLEEQAETLFRQDKHLLPQHQEAEQAKPPGAVLLVPIGGTWWLRSAATPTDPWLQQTVTPATVRPEASLVY